ncbi:hypothetical protein [Parachitinimonas caeni]|uniref:Uncharacterized protein n=1 Tax=Parachitinimonas caeni TaxID=3031301 RepID=A0ABT7DZF9_9NEIS|nr:hypothetical protein [Parachitinimonas caeni]MDK2125452.1 hypothetical protein [Parachitinimonas caeni]
MTQYIRCARVSGLVIDETPSPKAHALPFPGQYWVAVGDVEEGGWTQRSGDGGTPILARFVPHMPLHEGCDTTILRESQGRWQHQDSPEGDYCDDRCGNNVTPMTDSDE